MNSEYFPFSKLSLPAGEDVVWSGSNPTFHRSGDYGIVITRSAIYLFSPFWLWLARWRRYPISNIHQAIFKDSRLAPRLLLRTSGGVIRFCTPYDSYSDEMDFDRRNLAKAAELLTQLCAVSAASFVPTSAPDPDRDISIGALWDETRLLLTQYLLFVALLAVAFGFLRSAFDSSKLVSVFVAGVFACAFFSAPLASSSVRAGQGVRLFAPAGGKSLLFCFVWGCIVAAGFVLTLQLWQGMRATVFNYLAAMGCSGLACAASAGIPASYGRRFPS